MQKLTNNKNLCDYMEEGGSISQKSISKKDMYLRLSLTTFNSVIVKNNLIKRLNWKIKLCHFKKSSISSENISTYFSIHTKQTFHKKPLERFYLTKHKYSNASKNSHKRKGQILENGRCFLGRRIRKSDQQVLSK